MQTIAVRWLWERGLGLGLAVFALYVAVAPPYITDGDNGEFSALSAVGGVPHPSGYPLYILWLRATSWIPAQNSVHTAAISTCILGAALVVVLHNACRAWGARTAAAAVSALIFAIGPVVMKNHIKAEVFALNGLVVAGVVYLAAAAGPLRGVPRVFALGLVAGLGISDHLTCVLVAPVGLLGAVRGVRESGGRIAAIALGVGGLVLGLTPYLYLFVAPDTPSSWGTVDSFADLLHVFLRQDYGGPGAFAPSGKPIDVVANLSALGYAFGRGWLWVLLPGALYAWGRRIARNVERSEPRAGWITLAVAWLLAGPLLVMRFDIEPEGFGLAICERFYLLPLMLLAIPVALGLEDVLAVFERKVSPKAMPLLGVGAVFVALLAATQSIRVLARVHSPAVEQYTLNLLQTLPQDAVLITADDATYATIHYFQQQRGIRTDVVQVQWLLLALPWYSDRIAQRGIVALNGPTTKYASQRLALGVLMAGRPLFVDLAQTRVLELFPGYPHGVVIKIVPPGKKAPPIDEVLQINRELYDHFEFPYDLPGRDDDLITALHERYASPWNTLGRKLEGLGRKKEAEEAFARAKAIGPQD